MIQTALRVLAALCVFCGTFAVRAEAPMIHGFMDSSEEWDDDGTEAYAHYGFYAFRADGSTGGFTPISPIGPDNSWATEGAIYADGKYYCYAVTGTWSLYHLTFRVIDAESWKTTFSKSYTYKNSDKYSEESQRAYLVPADLTYDAIGAEFYAAARRGFGESDSYLCRVDRNTGELTRLVEIPLMVSLTADSHGTLYGLGMEGTLYTIDPAKGATEVAHTGLWPFRNRPFSATTDFSDNKIYWSFYGFTSENDWRYNVNAIKGVVTVDPATAATEMIWAYPRNEVFTSVNVLNAHPMAPAATGDLRFTSDSFASPDGTVTCTVPETTVNGTPMTGSVTVRTYVDSKLINTATAAPGVVTSAKVSGMTDGEHTAAVEMQYGEHTSLRTYASSYFGFDAPAAVSNLKLSADNSGTVATLTWDAPATTIHGNPVPTADIRYKVVRYPGEVIVKRSLSATSMTETITDDFASVRYVVTPYHVSDPAQPGPAAASNSVTLGKDLQLPYSETFDSPSSWNRFTAIDTTGDAYDDGKAQWNYDDAYYCAFYYGPDEHPADDW
ncbi:MAG: hypothetical protein K2M97_04330, partial [Muribaculaceae bacterium]|nr:hypothetical protein [Muribaculaceae bacterium]